MERTFELNGHTYVAKKFSYNLICDLDDMGISISEIADKPNAFIRMYVALSLGVSKQKAGDEIEKHLINGGDLEQIALAMTEAMEESDFFKSLQKKDEVVEKKKTTSTASKKKLEVVE